MVPQQIKHVASISEQKLRLLCTDISNIWSKEVTL